MKVRYLFTLITLFASLHLAAQPCTDQVTATYSPSVICTGKDMQLNASNVAGATYDWVGPNGFTSMQQNPVVSNISLASSGDYIVTATVGSCVYVDTVNINAELSPQLPSVTHNSPVCENDTLSMIAAIPQSIPMFFYWYGPNGFTALTTDGQPINRLYADTSMSGIYKVISKSPVSGCESDTSYWNLKVNRNIVPDVYVTATNTYVGPMTPITFTANVSNAGANPTYQWVKNSADIPGETGSTYTGTTGADLQNNDSVWVKVTADPALPCRQTTTSNWLRVRINLGVEDMAALQQPQLYPNPNKGRFAVNTQGIFPAGEPINIAITDMMGRSVLKQQADNTGGKLEINAGDHLPAGMYLLKMTAGGRAYYQYFSIAR